MQLLFATCYRKYFLQTSLGAEEMVVDWVKVLILWF